MLLQYSGLNDIGFSAHFSLQILINKLSVLFLSYVVDSLFCMRKCRRQRRNKQPKKKILGSHSCANFSEKNRTLGCNNLLTFSFHTFFDLDALKRPFYTCIYTTVLAVLLPCSTRFFFFASKYFGSKSTRNTHVNCSAASLILYNNNSTNFSTTTWTTARSFFRVANEVLNQEHHLVYKL